jgi:hypothetical protein
MGNPNPRLIFYYSIMNKVLEFRSSTQNAELKCLDEVDRKTQRECARFTFAIM